MTAPLDGVRVLDVTWGMPGAVASMLLADYGADVIQVVRPGGDPATVAGANRTWERSKRRLSVDLGDTRGRELVHGLARDADVVLVGLRAEAVARFGLDAEAVTAANPDVVYVALSGFGRHADRGTPGYEALVAAELGAMVTAPGHRPGPVFLGHPAISYSTAFLALIGTLAALRARILTGRGDVVDASLMDGLLAQLTMNWWSESRVSFLRSRTATGQLDMGHTRMLLRRFRCADGRLIQVHTGAAGAFGRLMKMLGLHGEISPASGPVEASCPLTDDDLVVLERTPDLFASRTSDEWLAELWANEIAALPVQRPGEVFADPQVTHNGLIHRMDDPVLGPIDVVGPPARLGGSPARAVGPSTVTALQDCDWEAAGLPPGGERGPARPGGPALPGGPLDGVRIVEFASFFAAPYANRLLGDLGAEVIKVEPLAGDPIRSLPDPFEGASRGKRSLAVDVKSPETRPLVEELLRSADVVQHNLRPGVAERLGIDVVSVRALNPEVVYDYAPGYGSTGPKSRLQSFAPLHSGFVGIHAEAAGEENEPLPTFGNEDYYNGQLNAIASLLALVHKARTGRGQYVECAQLDSSVFVTSHWYRGDGQRHSTLPTLDQAQTGWSAHQRIYQCLEGWLCVYCVTEAQRRALEGIASPESDAVGDVGERLQYELFGRSAADWCTALRAVGVPCAVVNEERWLHQFLFDEVAMTEGRVAEFHHTQHGRVRVINRLVRLAGLPARPPTRAPLLGEHTRAVAVSLGFGDDRVDELVAGGVLGTNDRVEP